MSSVSDFALVLRELTEYLLLITLRNCPAIHHLFSHLGHALSEQYDISDLLTVCVTSCH
jgi:hypothetical protein